MRYRLMRFPGGKAKAVTFSYDDGDRGDLRLLETIRVYNPTLIDVWFAVDGTLYKVKSGQEILIQQ